MTRTVEDDDFGGFVAARWPDLEAVALVATGDPGQARELTARALGGLGGRWEEVLEEGAPTCASRAALLRELARPVRAPRPGRRPAPRADSDPGPGLVPDAEDEDVVGRRLVEVLMQEPPLVRAAVAAEVRWQWDVAETAHRAATAPGPLVDGLDAVRERLLDAHREALADEGHSPADWRLDRDLADALDALVDAQPDPPDPADLVTRRAHRVRRRSVLTGGAALVATGAATWWVLRDAPAGREAPVASAGSGSALRPTAPDGDVWTSTGSWPPRGSLADDAWVRALVLARGRPGGRLLFADDVAGTRVVVAGLLGPSTGDAEGAGTVLQAWTGPAGTAVEDLVDVALPTDRTAGAADVVAVALPRAREGGTYTTRVVLRGSEPGGPGTTAHRGRQADAEGLLLVLTRPDVGSATWSPVVHPTANGSVERTWTLVRLEGGVGVRVLERTPGAAARIDVAEYDGPVAGTPAPPTTPGWLDPVDAVTAYVAAATGEDPRELRSEVVIDSPVAGDVLDASAVSARGGDGRARVIHTTTSDGALVRTLHLADDGRSGRASRLGRPAVLPVADADAPLVQRLDTVAPRTTRYLVVAPGAARCQLIATTPAGYPVCDVTPMKADTAVLPVINGQGSEQYRLVLWGPDGERLYSAVPPRARPLLDLWTWR